MKCQVKSSIVKSCYYSGITSHIYVVNSASNAITFFQPLLYAVLELQEDAMKTVYTIQKLNEPSISLLSNSEKGILYENLLTSINKLIKENKTQLTMKKTEVA